MSTLPTLPNLPALTEAASSAASAVSSAADAVQNADSFLASKETSIVMILLGILLIAAGIFSFDKTREVIVGAGRTVGRTAGAAASLA